MKKLLGLWLVLCHFAWAGDGNWANGVSDDKKSAYAATINDSNGVLMQSCELAEQTCVWLIKLNQGCEIGSSYPVLANSASGAGHLKLLCKGSVDGGGAAYYFQDFDEIDNLIRGADRIGFAIPLEKGSFAVSKFDLTGSNAIIDQMRDAVHRFGGTQNSKAPTKKNTRDENL